MFASPNFGGRVRHNKRVFGALGSSPDNDELSLIFSFFSLVITGYYWDIVRRYWGTLPRGWHVNQIFAAESQLVTMRHAPDLRCRRTSKEASTY